MARRLLPILALITVLVLPAYAQERTEEQKQDLSDRTMALDLRTATYFELVAWCERLDLSTRGARSELQKRL